MSGSAAGSIPMRLRQGAAAQRPQVHPPQLIFHLSQGLALSPHHKPQIIQNTSVGAPLRSAPGSTRRG